MGRHGTELLEIFACDRFSGFFNSRVRRHLCGFDTDNRSNRRYFRRDLVLHGLYRPLVFYAFQDGKPCKIRIQRTLRGVQMKKYKIIYADPPWRYERSKVQGAAEKHYPTMSIEDLCALPVKEIADKDCILFLWATFPQLKEALQLIKAWDFTYKSVAFVWLKQNRKSPTWFYGLGFWTRGNAEICLLATKGHPKRQSNKVHQFIISPVEQHSKKPDITREKILALMGDLPRIELFARQHTPGWDVWGNEIKSDIRFAGKEV